ncbi:MAG: AraC family transcriptional regulator [Nostoc sp.]|uniref:helix-turn-helix transcriptional regulator n=1 Tax=Nostoc sp. TaxID=1180 RepID=UPI002FFC610F
MTVIYSQAGFREIVAASQEKDPAISDGFVTRWKIPELVGRGIAEFFELRQGLNLFIHNWQLRHDYTIADYSQSDSWLHYGFCLSSERFRLNNNVINSRQYVLWGKGMSQSEVAHLPAVGQGFWIRVDMMPQLLYSFVGDASGQLPAAFEHLVKPPDEERSLDIGTTTAAMQVALQQILQCPYQDMTQKMYLEGKIWELTALLLEQVKAKQDLPDPIWQLKPEDVDRIHYAKELLLNRLDNPPSLTELARQVGLNDCTLKRGFQQVFAKSAFSYLHDYRLEQARQLLTTGEMKVAEVAEAIGFADPGYLARAFRKKFGCYPGCYRRPPIDIFNPNYN